MCSATWEEGRGAWWIFQPAPTCPVSRGTVFPDALTTSECAAAGAGLLLTGTSAHRPREEVLVCYTGWHRACTLKQRKHPGSVPGCAEPRGSGVPSFPLEHG